MTNPVFPMVTKVTATIIIVDGGLMIKLTAPDKPAQILTPEPWLIDFFNLRLEFEQVNGLLTNKSFIPNENWIPAYASKRDEKLTSVLSPLGKAKP